MHVPLDPYDHLGLSNNLKIESIEDPDTLSMGKEISNSILDAHWNGEQAQDLNELNNLEENIVEEHEVEYDISLLKVCLEESPNQALGMDIPDGRSIEEMEIKIKTEMSVNKNNNEILQKNVEVDVEHDTLEKMSKATEIESLSCFDMHISLPDSNKNAETVVSECTFQTMVKSSSKLYKCSECIFSTYHKGVLKRHSILHSKIKPFICKVCPYSSSRKENFKTHCLKHTSDDKKAYKCDKCNFGSIWKGSYTRHMESHNTQKTPCPYCDFNCIRKSYLRQHVYNKHK